MKNRILAFVFLVLLHTMCQAGERWEFRGTVRDRTTRDPLPAANVRILGTSKGTIANSNGVFTLPLEEGEHTIVISSLGYRPDTLRITMTAGIAREIALQQEDIVMPEVVVTSEDPAIEIIRRAIANKKKWSERLQTYRMEAFTRQTIRRDTAIAAIAESYTKGYWQKGDTLREIIRQKRQTANLGAAENFAAVGRILNFNEDRIRFVGFSFVGPTADDALEYYDYKLLQTHQTSTGEIYDIRMVPRSRTVPLFSGEISIAGDSYALMGVDVEPNETFVIPFVSERRLRYRQQFALYDQYYWMPVDIRIEGAFRVGFMGFSIPKIGIEQTSAVYEYEINMPLPDSVFRKPRLTVDSSATKVDSLFWASTQVLPLNTEEQKAYTSLDSTQRLDVQFRPSGATATLGGGKALELLQYLDAGFNRVEGFRLGGKVDLEKVTSWLDLRGGFAYGFSDKRSKYFGGVTAYTSGARSVGMSGDFYHMVDHRPDGGYYGMLFNSLTALFVKNDYRDYFANDGWRAGIVVAPSRMLRAGLAFVSEKHSTLLQATDYSFFNHDGSYRPNPAVEEGNLRALALDLRWGGEPVPFDLVTRDRLEMTVEHTGPELAGSDFHFTRMAVVGTGTVSTFGEGFLLRPQLRIRFAAGTSTGALPSQRWFDLESSSSGFGPFGVMRGLHVKEFSGVGYAAVNIEHNFRSLPFLALSIPFLYEKGIEVLAHGGAARLWSRDGLVSNPTEGWYFEAGLGLGRILELLRVDGTWRFSTPSRFVLTLAMSSFL
jgi:hypothetical protein